MSPTSIAGLPDNSAWVSVGPLRADVIGALSPIAQDVVIAGLDRDYVAVLIVPDLKACGRLVQKEGFAYSEVATHEEVTAWIRLRLQRHAERNAGATRCVRRPTRAPSCRAAVSAASGAVSSIRTNASVWRFAGLGGSTTQP